MNRAQGRLARGRIRHRRWS